MPSRAKSKGPKGRSSASAADQQATKAGGGGGGGLKPIESGLPKAELLRRLKTLAQTLADLDQEPATLDMDLDQYAAALVQPFVLNHRDPSVRLLAACAASDVLRVYAPDAPYAPFELTAIFNLFVGQLRGLADPDSALFPQTYHLLRTLAVVKSFILCLDAELVPDAGDTLASLFRLLFECVSETHTPKLVGYMLDIMDSVIEESDTLGEELFDAIFENLVPARARERPAAYDLARSLVARAASSLQACVHPFFINLLGTTDVEETPLGAHVHDLILEVDRIDHGILLRVLPHLEYQLRSEDTACRLRATTTLAKMFSRRESSLMTQERGLWSAFLERFRDAKPEIRTECVRFSKYFLVYHSSTGGGTEVGHRLKQAIKDTDDSVRAAAVTAVMDAATERLGAVTPELLHEACERRLDRRQATRLATLERMATLYNTAAIRSGLDALTVPWPESTCQRLDLLPTAILRTYHANDAEMRACITRLVDKTLLPPQQQGEAVSDEIEEGEEEGSSQSRADKRSSGRMLAVVASLDAHALTALVGLLATKRRAADDVRALCAAARQGPSAEAQANFRRALAQLVARLPERDRKRAREQLNELAGGILKGALKALETAVTPGATDAVVTRARAQFAESLCSRVGAVHASVHTVIDMAVPLAMTHGALADWLERLCVLAEQTGGEGSEEVEEAGAGAGAGGGGGGGAAAAAADNVVAKRNVDVIESCGSVLLALARHQSAAFADERVVRLLDRLLSVDMEEATPAGVALTTAVLHLLPLVRNAIAVVPGAAASIRQCIHTFAVQGTPVQAKLSVLYLADAKDTEQEAGGAGDEQLPLLPKATKAARTKALKQVRAAALRRQEVLKSVYDELIDEVLDLDAPALETALTALGYIALRAPDVFEQRQKEVVSDFIVKKLLLTNAEPHKKERASDPEWYEDEEISVTLRSKVLGIKCIVRRLLGRRDLPATEHAALAQPTMRLLMTLLEGAGELKADLCTAPWDRSRLRLGAALGMLKLAGVPALRRSITPMQFLTVAFTIQDSCVEVRTRFAEKLNRYLMRFQLPLAYMAMFTLAAIDPVVANVRAAAKYLRNNALRRRRKLEQIGSSGGDSSSSSSSSSSSNNTLQPGAAAVAAADESSASSGASSGIISEQQQARYSLNLLPEYALPHVVSLLANHPDFSCDDTSALSEFAVYLNFFFVAIISKDCQSYPFLKSLLTALKTVAPVQVPEAGPTSHHTVCDLALLLLARASEKPGWKLTEFPGEIVLPPTLFRKLSSPINPKKRYLPDNFALPTSFGRSHIAAIHAQAKDTTAGARATASERGRGGSGATSPSKRSTTKRKVKRVNKKKRASPPAPEQPTRRNAGRQAKSAIGSLADRENSSSSESESESESEAEHEGRASEEGSHRTQWRATVATRPQHHRGAPLAVADENVPAKAKATGKAMMGRPIKRKSNESVQDPNVVEGEDAAGEEELEAMSAVRASSRSRRRQAQHA